MAGATLAGALIFRGRSWSCRRGNCRAGDLATEPITAGVGMRPADITGTMQRVAVPSHSAPLTFGTADRTRRKDLFIDFGMEVGLSAFIVGLACTSSVVSGAIALLLSVAFAMIALAGLWMRIRLVAATLEADTLRVRNVFWSYRVPLGSVHEVIARRVHVFAIYTDCFGLRTAPRNPSLEIDPHPCSVRRGRRWTTSGTSSIRTVPASGHSSRLSAWPDRAMGRCLGRHECRPRPPLRVQGSQPLS